MELNVSGYVYLFVFKLIFYLSIPSLWTTSNSGEGLVPTRTTLYTDMWKYTDIWFALKLDFEKNSIHVNQTLISEFFFSALMHILSNLYVESE